MEHHRLSARLRLAAGLVALALAVSGCVNEAGTAAPEAPAITTDPSIYAARSDGNFALPALPVEQIPETYRRQVVDYASEEAPGTIIIDPSSKLLYYILGKGKALRYGIAVGRAGFQWSGEAVVANKRYWPTWTPPREMIARDPKLSKWENGQPGGPTNPLGARAIYLTSGGVDYGYRIHGTPEWRTIGRNASSGCIRMINQDVIDLFERVGDGNKVIVLTARGEMPNGLSIPKPPAVKKPAEPEPPATAVAAREGPPPSGFIGPTLPAAGAAAPAAGAEGPQPASPAADAAAPGTPAAGTASASAPAEETATGGEAAAEDGATAGNRPAGEPAAPAILCEEGATGSGCPSL